MRTFHYEALNARGQSISGQMDEETPEAVISALRAKGLFPTAVEAVTPMSPEQMQQVADAIAGNKKIEAIKLYRSFTGSDLKDSKECIEKLSVQLHEKDPGRYPAMPAGKGCLGLLLAGIGLLILEIIRAT